MRTPKKILERRRSVRIQEVVPFQLNHHGYEIKAITINISRHGTMCLVKRDIALMTQLEVGLALSKTSIIRARGVVVRKEKDPVTGGFFLALFFSKISPKDREKLNRFIDERLKG